MHINCFNIGTGHNRNEQNNLLVRLAKDCTFNRETLINDGVGSKDSATGRGGKSGLFGKGINAGNFQGWGIKDLTKATVEQILKERENVTHVYVAGHSRGAILSVRIAAYLFEKAPEIPVHLFLLDPVLQSGLGTASYNREIHSNVRNIRIVVAEDVGNKSTFPLKLLKSRPVKKADCTLLDPGCYIRIPGSHGTGSQVAGGPIGELVFGIAKRHLHAWGCEISPVPSAADICECYFRIQEKNPFTTKDTKNGISLTRRVNDEDKKKGYNMVNKDSRVKFLDRKGITNVFRGTRVFVNEHHFVLFNMLYPSITKQIIFVKEGTGEPVDSRQLRSEANRLIGSNPVGFSLIRQVYPSAVGE